MFVYGSEVENCDVCNCYWFAACVTTWFAEPRTKAVSLPFEPRLRTSGGASGEGAARTSFVGLCVLLCKESFKDEIILIKTIKPPWYTLHGTTVHSKAFLFATKCPETEEFLHKQLYT